MTRLLFVVGVVAACGGGGDDRPVPVDRPPQRRVIEPPTGEITAGPPYPITQDSIGPYKLRQSLTSLGDRLKGSALRFEIPNLLHTGLIRAEDDTILIGSEPTTFAASQTTYLAVTGSEVARLDGVHVGSSRDEALRLGNLTDDLERARDPRLLAPSKNTRLVIENKQVVAIVLLPEPAREATISHEECARPVSPQGSSAFGACLTGAGELVERDGDDITVKADDKIIWKAPPLPGVVFAAPLRYEGRDELAVVTRIDDTAQKTWNLIVFRFEAGGFKRVALESSVLYQVGASQSRWIGAELSEVELYLELTNRGEAIEVAGFFIRLGRDRVRDVAMISPVTVARRHHKPALPEAGDAGVVGSAAGGSQGSARP